jgi:hypothetical protein
LRDIPMGIAMDFPEIDAALFLNYGADRWWRFKDTATGSTVRIDSSSTSSGLIQLKQSGASPIVHILQSKPVAIFGTETLQYTWLQSTSNGQTVHWGDGLTLPTPWKVGESVSATSTEPNPATGNAVRFTLKLEKLTTFKPQAGSPIGGEIPAVEVGQVISDVRLGTVLASGTTIFGLGVGMVAIRGQVFGVFSFLQLESWSGTHGSQTR